MFGGVGGFGLAGHGAADFFDDADSRFLDVAGLEGAQVIRGFEAFAPGAAVHVAEDAEVGVFEEEVDALALIDPFLAAGGGIDDGFVTDTEDCLVLSFEVIGDGLDGIEFSVEVFQLIEHLGAPQAGFFEVLDEVGVEDDEVAGEVGLDVEVFVVRLDAGGGAHDVADGGGRRDGEDVGVAHAVFGDFFADEGPVHFAAAWGIDLDAALLFEEVDGVLGKQAAVPLGAFVGGVGAALGREIGGSTIGIVGDGFHELVIELDGCLGAEGETFFVEGILQAHDAEADGAVAGVCGLGSDGGVEVDVDDAIKGADGDGDGFLEHLVVDDAVLADVGIEDDGAEVADGGFFIGGVEGDLGAQVR